MTGDFLDESNFLRDHEPRIRDFLTTIHGQLDHAVEKPDNNGPLVLPLNDENLRAAKWKAIPPELPPHLKKLLPFKPNEPVEVHARYRYGRASALVNIWVSSFDRDSSSKSFSLGLSVNPRSGKVVKGSNMNNAGSDQTRNIAIHEGDARAVMNAIFANNTAYENQEEKDSLDTATLLQLGIATQADCGAELYTVESAGKIFAVLSRSGESRHLNGFDLSVRVVDRAHPNDKPSKTCVALTRHFDPDDYSPDELYSGVLTKGIKIEQDAAGRITSIKRESQVRLFNEPVRIKINGEERFVSGASQPATDIPDELVKKLYPSPTPTLDDLAYFERLITQPVKGEDCYI